VITSAGPKVVSCPFFAAPASVRPLTLSIIINSLFPRRSLMDCVFSTLYYINWDTRAFTSSSTSRVETPHARTLLGQPQKAPARPASTAPVRTGSRSRPLPSAPQSRYSPSECPRSSRSSRCARTNARHAPLRHRRCRLRYVENVTAMEKAGMRTYVVLPKHDEHSPMQEAK
jgi:hypothetical protein